MVFSTSIVLLETAFHEMVVQNTSDYQTIQTLYNEVVKNEVELFKNLELNDPVSAFVGYVNMYRGGYLSSDKKFTYDTKPKDFKKMNGSDVVSGKGVCRSIASMLNDIYKEMGFDSTTLVVNASREAIDSMEHLSTMDLDKREISEETKKFVKMVEKITKVTGIGNHLVTAVRDDEKSYVFDPTNDGLLIPQRTFNLITGTGPKQKMIYKPVQSIGSNDGNIKRTLEILKGNSITKDEYKEIYLNSQKRIQENMDLLEKFYEENKDIYKEIEEISDKSEGLIDRFLPVAIKAYINFSKQGALKIKEDIEKEKNDKKAKAK